MQNEKHCGNVLRWKTYTYDFGEHKKWKNSHDKPQVLKNDHHEGIVSHEVFDAAQHKMASEKYMKKGLPLPALEVIEEGVLKGYVSVNRMWAGFSETDYSEASAIVYENGTETKNNSEVGFSLEGYQVVRNQFFSTTSKPTMNISKGKVRFNSVCLKKFEDVEYVELLLNSVEKCIAVRPCEPDNPNAIRWGKLQDSKWIVMPKSCSGFAGPLYSIMDWEANCGYKLCGQYVSDGEEQVLFFDLSDPEVTLFEQVEIENPEELEQGQDYPEEAEYREEKRVIYPSSWGRKVGEDCIVFMEMESCDNWKIMQPASVFRLSGNIAQDTMKQVRMEAETLLNSFLIAKAE